ncbi:SusD/RagB family nutrient-binding outer membrane lipoprotein [Sphingobacterium psychroaquaticum]|uniref:Starch-binding associating with outer membrane n=1 Tax=Sphingobacterium psychroaquaticum TaxID=561061 RepID=A0A1X7JSX0_9SPHI|nr:SusD/RagB family nutrient-binding outer membrane lipoprotein [Sphingobacterium psychroaquaticum]SMG31387.1 Starch-binding associating with outer membrane [Sphingobacterium psychroaquaticum]
MKNIKRFFIPSLCAVALLSITGCTKDFVDINTNPATYGSTNFDANYTLSSAQLNYTGSIDFAYDTWRANLIYSSGMIQGMSTVVSYWAGDKYMLNEGYTAAYWGTSAVGAYIEQVRFIVDVIEFTKDKPEASNLYNVARIWKAVIFSRLSDIYGDVPYSEAGLGYYKKIYTPKYDKQQDIYNDMLKELDEASQSFKDGGDFVKGDIIYGGDLNKWKRFANSFMLRLAMRLVKVDEAKAKEYAAKAVGKTFTSNSDNALVKHSRAGARVTQNRNSQVLLGDGGSEAYYTKWSKTFIDFLKAHKDPRLGKITVTNLYLKESDKDEAGQNPNFSMDPAVQKGMPNGKDLGSNPIFNVKSDPNWTTFSDYSSPHPVMIAREAPTFILTYGATELLLAEAAVRWGIGGSAEDHYKNGVKAAITNVGQYSEKIAISDATADACLAANPFKPAEALKQINTQYWGHTVSQLDFIETWSNWKRTGYPELVMINYPGNATGGTIPRRFPYPVSEVSENGVHYKEAAAAVPGGDKLTGRVWWDK